MNHHYPDNYHGYVRGAASMQNISYGHGGYEEQMTMGQMTQSRNSYQLPQYRDSGQMHPLMQHQQQNSMYPSGGYMGQMNASSYGMSGYSNYGMASQANMNSSPMMIGPRGNMMGGYYNHPMDSQTSTRTQVAGPNASYNQGASGNSLHCQNQMNHMPPSQNCSPQTAPMQGGQVSHCASPHAMTATHSNSGFQGQGPAVNHGMIPGAQGQQHSLTGNRSGSSIHAIPQHPMRHPSTQQNPQEVADNILQIASSYPANQTVQVPLKSRHAPYHIPRSPHYSMSSSDHGHSSPMTTHSQQASPAPQPSPTPSSSSVKSPTPSLGPIPNPIPSPGISGLRSPCNQGASACGAQRSPAHMASSYSGHSQPSPSPHHFSPSSIGNQQNFLPFTQSPTAPRNTVVPYSHAQDQNIFSNSDNQDLKPSYSSPLPSSNSPHSQNIMPSDMPPSSNVQFSQQGKGNNPLMSLQKLVMLPETQVVDPKSVVNDACLSSQSNENEEFPKNGEDPAEGCAESSDSSVGCPGQSSSHISCSTEQTQPESEPKASNPGFSSFLATNALARDTSEAIENSDDKFEKAPHACVEHSEMDGKISQSICPEQKQEPDFSSKPASPLHRENTGFNNAKVNASADDITAEKKGVSEPEANCDGFHRQNEKPKEIPEMKLNESPDPTDINVRTKSVSETIVSESNDSSSEQQNGNMLHSLKHKNGKVNGLNEDVKHPFQCKSSGVLSEVPLLVNGLSTSGSVSDGNDHDSDGDVDRKIQNGFSSRLRSKLRIGEKTGQFIRLTTPCSIAVGADERAMCERFVLRRNDYCHTLRTSRLLCNGRTRQDSTGNGDSDESIENVADGSFHALGNPQDGCKKKTSASAKRNEVRNSAVNSSSHLPKKDGLVSHRDGQVGNASNNHVSNSNEHNTEASDEDGEVCYYEGVDSSDFFMHTVSSDDSISSNQEVKQTSQNNSSTSADQKAPGSGSLNKEVSQEDEKKKASENISSPPSKRTKRSSGQNSAESVQGKFSSSRCISNSSNKVSEIATDASTQADSSELDLKNQNSCQENGKINRTRFSKRKSPALTEKPFTNDQHKLPEVVVRLEKSPIVEGGPLKVEPMENTAVTVKKEKMTPIVIDDESPEKYTEMAYTKSDVQGSIKIAGLGEEPSIKDDAVRIGENEKVNSIIKSEVVMDSGAAIVTPSEPSAAHTKAAVPSKKKRTCKKGKKQISSVRIKDKNDELKDSFKSMKFSRTLHMMKSHKKKESSSTGPFLRIEGSRSAPNTVSVFNQSSQDSLPLANKQKHNHRQSLSRGSATVHVVSSLSNDKMVMVSSNKVVPNQQWSCAFCSHQSSFQSLGDLFGPYFKEADLPVVESIALEEGKKGDSSKDSPKSSNISLKAKASPADKKGSRKRKLSTKTEQCLPQEIWLHESCALWAPGVYLIGNRIYGLDDAIRDTAETTCSVCKGKGAMIGCLFKGCAMKYHFACAIEKDCHLNEGNFSLLCPKHKDKKFNMAPSSSPSSSSVLKES